MNIIFIYNATQTYTNTVFEHLASFARYSRHRVFFCHHDQSSEFAVELSHFDAIAIHYSVRLPYDQLSPQAARELTDFTGLKVLFIQDEYEHTYRAWHWIRNLGIELVFTVVPEAGIGRVYPAQNFPGVRFVSNLTGYVPDWLKEDADLRPPSQRQLLIGYRGRPLPLRYGMLGLEKVAVGRIAKAYCDAHGIESDIAWNEESRIYGPKWYEFMTSCRAMLGSESGSNVFDWDASLDRRVADYRNQNPDATDDEVYQSVVRGEEVDGIMNQVSPRVFEAIAARTVLVLLEGNYSGVVKAGEHFIPLRKDGSNMAEVVELLQDGSFVDAMVERAFRDVVESGRYSYESFVRLVDAEIERSQLDLKSNDPAAAAAKRVPASPDASSPLTTWPVRAKPVSVEAPAAPPVAGWRTSPPGRLALCLWLQLPDSFRRRLKPLLLPLVPTLRR